MYSSFWYFFLCSLGRCQSHRRFRWEGRLHEGDVATGAWQRGQLPCHLQTQGRRAAAGYQGARWQDHHHAEKLDLPHHLRDHSTANLPLWRGQSQGRRGNNTYVGLPLSSNVPSPKFLISPSEWPPTDWLSPKYLSDLERFQMFNYWKLSFLS